MIINRKLLKLSLWTHSVYPAEPTRLYTTRDDTTIDFQDVWEKLHHKHTRHISVITGQ